MGRVLLLAAVVVAAIVLSGWGLFLSNRKARTERGLQDTEKKIAALEASQSRQAAVLNEIRNLAATEITLAEQEHGESSTMWHVVHGLANQALTEEDKR